MNKHVSFVIGIAIAAVIFTMAYRVATGAGGTVKVGGNEVTVSPGEPAESLAPSVQTPADRQKVVRDFERSFNFENHSCGTNEDVKAERCVDDGYILTGMVGEPFDLKADSCGSYFISFGKKNDTCGDINVHLQGCGFTSIKTCKGHAKYIGKIRLSGYKYE